MDRFLRGPSPLRQAGQRAFTGRPCLDRLVARVRVVVVLDVGLHLVGAGYF